MFLNDKIVSHLPNWKNVPFHFRRYDKYGCDCTGLLVGILSDINKDHGFIKDYHAHSQGNYIDGEVLFNTVARYSCKVDEKTAEPGDIALFSLAKGQTNHLGIISGVNPIYMMHTDRMIKKVVENSVDQYWKERLTIIFRLKE